jgi:hypothetical protein
MGTKVHTISQSDLQKLKQGKKNDWLHKRLGNLYSMTELETRKDRPDLLRLSTYEGTPLSDKYDTVFFTINNAGDVFLEGVTDATGRPTTQTWEKSPKSALRAFLGAFFALTTK